MRLITLLNHCKHFSDFVYEKAPSLPTQPDERNQNAAAARLQAGVLWLP
jgi:hypothetical protein